MLEAAGISNGEVPASAVTANPMRWRNVFENGDMGLLLCQLNGDIMQCNNMFCRLFSLQRMHVLGSNLFTFISSEHLPRAILMMQNLLPPEHSAPVFDAVSDSQLTGFSALDDLLSADLKSESDMTAKGPHDIQLTSGLDTLHGSVYLVLSLGTPKYYL